jgi:hypothetical protein
MRISDVAGNLCPALLHGDSGRAGPRRHGPRRQGLALVHLSPQPEPFILSSTFNLNLSRFCHGQTETTQCISQKNANVELKSGRGLILVLFPA